jgi:hypothetical protein
MNDLLAQFPYASQMTPSLVGLLYQLHEENNKPARRPAFKKPVQSHQGLSRADVVRSNLRKSQKENKRTKKITMLDGKVEWETLPDRYVGFQAPSHEEPMRHCVEFSTIVKIEASAAEAALNHGGVAVDVLGRMYFGVRKSDIAWVLGGADKRLRNGIARRQGDYKDELKARKVLSEGANRNKVPT